MGFAGLGRLPIDTWTTVKDSPMTNHYGLYAKIFDGLRSFYEQRGGEKSAPAFRAAGVLSLICFLGVGSAIMLTALLTGKALLLIDLLYRWRIIVAVVGAMIVIAAHVAWAKRGGLYSRVGAPLSTNWVRPFVGIAVTAAIFLILFFVAAYIKGNEARQLENREATKAIASVLDARTAQLSPAIG